MARLTFWYEFASSYSYPAAMRLEAAAAARGVEVEWAPFLLGPIFASIGLREAPFANGAKRRYMQRDLERICAALNLPFVLPAAFPASGLLAARMTLALPQAQRPAFSRALYSLEFGEGADIADQEVVAEALRRVGLDTELLVHAADEGVKQGLRDATAKAQELGVFGAPSFVTAGGELFWGNDRLEDALDWARQEQGLAA
jgi:2-hydroxychromene-2-carboxylate isomerase